MNPRAIAALVAKDLKLYFKNRFFALVTVLALVGYAAIYFLMPAEVDETLELAIYAPEMPAAFTSEFAAEGLVMREYASKADLQQAVESGDFNVGVALPDNYIARLAVGEDVTVEIFFASDFPVEFQDFYVLFIREISYTVAGQALNLDVTETVLGRDLVGEQIPARDRMLPMFAVFILVMETMGLASLITTEVEARTIQALLVTPLNTGGLFLSKGIMGTGLAFTQAALLMLLVGGFKNEPLIMVAALLLGSLLATALAFLLASVARDMMSVMGWAMLAIVLLAIPTFNILLPGSVSGWIRGIPSYYLAETIHEVANFGSGWPEVSASLWTLLAFTALFFGLGVGVLQRKFR